MRLIQRWAMWEFESLWPNQRVIVGMAPDNQTSLVIRLMSPECCCLYTYFCFLVNLFLILLFCLCNPFLIFLFCLFNLFLILLLCLFNLFLMLLFCVRIYICIYTYIYIYIYTYRGIYVGCMYNDVWIKHQNGVRGECVKWIFKLCLGSLE